jgi:hypothetical protein
VSDTTVRLVLDGAEMHELLRGNDGPVVRHLIRVGDAVKADARRNIKNRSGALGKTLVKRQTVGPTGAPGIMVIAGIGLKKGYAVWVHEGNGPPGGRIFPKKAANLVFMGREGHLISVPSVKTSRPNPYLRKALRVVPLTP